MKTRFGPARGRFWAQACVVLCGAAGTCRCEEDAGKKTLEDLKASLREALQSVSNDAVSSRERQRGASQAAAVARAMPAEVEKDPEARKTWEKQEAEARKKAEKEAEEAAKAAEKAQREAEKEAKKRREREEELAERSRKEGARYVPERGETGEGPYYNESRRSERSGGWVQMGGVTKDVNSSSSSGPSSSRERGTSTGTWGVRTTVIRLEGPEE
jgi:membrane protein involved in colicin uptake